MQVVIIGAGYAGLTTALRLARSRSAGRIILVNDRPEHTLTTQLHRVAAGALPPALAQLSLARLLHGTGVELLVGQVTSIEPKQARITMDDGAAVPYDCLVVALGSQTETFGVPGVLEYSLQVQPLDRALQVRSHIRNRLHQAAALAGAERAAALRFTVVGGGLTGVELAGELADQLPEAARKVGIAASELTITVVEAGPRLLPGRLTASLADEATAVLARKGVEVRTNSAIKAITADGVVLSPVPRTFAAAHGASADRADHSHGSTRTHARPHGEFLPSGTVIWTAGVRSHRLTETTFASGARGRAVVDEYLRAVDYPNVYILGDNALAVTRGSDRAAAPSAQNAVQQAAVVADNIAAEARAMAGHSGDEAVQATIVRTPYIFKPLGVFVSVGRGEAVGQLIFGDFWRPRLSGMPAYAVKWASEQRYKLGIGASLGG